MSKRLRLESQRLLQAKDDENVQEDWLQAIKDRIYAPVTWKELPNGIKIMDLKEAHYEEVLEMMKDCFIPEDVLTKNAEMELDETSTKSFLDHCVFQMKDTTSLIAINTECDPPDIVGCCLNRAINKDDFGRVFSGTIMKDGEAQGKCMKIQGTLNRKVNIFDLFDCHIYLKISSLCIKPCYRHCDYGFEMIKAVYNSARSLRIPVIAGIFSNHTIQRCVKKLGMQVIEEISYVQWTNKETGALIFDDPGPGNYTIAFMAGRVPAEPFKDKLIPPPPEPVETPILTRQDRREMAAKKKKRELRLANKNKTL